MYEFPLGSSKMHVCLASLLSCLESDDRADLVAEEESKAGRPLEKQLLANGRYSYLVPVWYRPVLGKNKQLYIIVKRQLDKRGPEQILTFRAKLRATTLP